MTLFWVGGWVLVVLLVWLCDVFPFFFPTFLFFGHGCGNLCWRLRFPSVRRPCCLRPQLLLRSNTRHRFEEFSRFDVRQDAGLTVDAARFGVYSWLLTDFFVRSAAEPAGPPGAQEAKWHSPPTIVSKVFKLDLWFGETQCFGSCPRTSPMKWTPLS